MKCVSMKIPLVSLARQYTALKEEIDRTISDVIEKGSYILGENVRQFEREFAQYCGTRYAIGVASGTDALTLSLAALGVSRGNQVITVANTFISTVDSITRNSATPQLVDVNPKTYVIDEGAVEKQVKSATVGILPVHLYGHPAELDIILEIAEKNGLWVVEDACQAHDSEFRGRRVGGFGDVACFSFYPSKNLGAYGDAGMVVTDDSNLAKVLMLLRNYGQKTKHLHSMVGYNSRMDELQAAILRVKLRHLNDWVDARRRLAEGYNDRLKGLGDIVTPIEFEHVKHSYHLYVIRTDRRDELMKWLASRGIETGIHYPTPIHLQEAYRHLNYSNGSLSLTEQLSKEILSLPLFPELQEEELDYIASSIKSFYDHR